MLSSTSPEQFTKTLKHRLLNTSKTTLFVTLALILSLISIAFVTFIGVISLHLRQRDTKFVDLCLRNEENAWRLPQNVVIPQHYSLDLTSVKLHPEWRFEAAVKILLRAQQKTTCVQLHAEDLDIKSIKMYETDEEVTTPSLEATRWDSFQEPSQWSVDENHGYQLHLKFDTPLEAYKYYVLEIEYKSEVRKDLRGFYQSEYTTTDGSGNSQSHYVGVTQFESVDARSAFPCFDEPAFKASFQLSISLDADQVEKYAIISNTPVEKSETNSGKTQKSVLFKRTPVMSTYLFAWVIGEFEAVTDTVAVDDRQVPVSVYAPLGEKNKGEYALSVAKKVMQALVQYWGISKSILEKMDLIAIPDFHSGAMENFAILTFRKSRLLLEADATVAQKEDVALVTAHELAHQTSGNTFTARWWNQLYLNEGMANFFEHKLLELAFKDDPDMNFDPWQVFLTAVTQTALAQDALPTAHALTFPANTSLEIDSMFSSITYDKGASLLRMMQSYLGEEQFQKWLRNFAADHIYSNVDTNDFIRALAQTIPDTEGTQIRQWIERSGFPVVTVHKDAEDTYHLSQARFWSHEPIQGTMEKFLWWIPVTYQSTPSDGTGTTEKSSFTFSSSKSESFKTKLLTLNVARTGFYRVNYPESHWKFLGEHIAANMDSEEGALPAMGLSEADRFGLVDDVLALARAGNIRIGTALQFLQSFKYEQSLSVWEAIIRHLMKMQLLVGMESSYESFCRYVYDLLNVVYVRVGWEEKANESMAQKRLRALVMQAMVRFEYSHAIEEALKLYDNSTVHSVPGNLNGAVYESVVVSRGEIGFIDLETRFQDATLDSERRSYAYALVMARKPSLIKRALELVSGAGIRGQDAPFILRSAAHNIYGGDLTWDYVRDQIENLIWKCGESLVTTRLLPGVTSQFSSLSRYKEVEDFLNRRPHYSEISRNIMLEQIRENIHFLGYNHVDLKKWLKDQGFDQLPFFNQAN